MELSLLGLRVSARGDDPSFLCDLGYCFETTPSDVGAPAGAADLTLEIRRQAPEEDARSALVHTTPRGLLDEFLLVPASPIAVARALTAWAVSAAEHHYVFHAAAISAEGRAILMPGASHSGKTTIAPALLRGGFELLSDEVGALEPRSMTLSDFARALFIREDVLSLLDIPRTSGRVIGSDGTRVINAAELGVRRTTADPTLSMIVTPSFRAGSNALLERLTPGATVVALMGTALSQERFKKDGFELLVQIAQQVPCYRLVYSDLERALSEIRRAFWEG